MRIIAGEFKGRRLQSPKDRAFRPTQDKVKEALFSILGDRIKGQVFMDLCCGTGGIGLEALSRGGGFVYFVDVDTASVHQNTAQIAPYFETPPFEIAQLPVLHFLRRTKAKADFLFFDPPWDRHHYYGTLLKAMADFDILSDRGLAIFEHNKRLDLKAVLADLETPFQLTHQYDYGNAILSFIQKKSP
ncbi:MAG: RsmD family RNA methyltransferase [Candidatus Margulisiibacteriota bacterium]